MKKTGITILLAFAALPLFAQQAYTIKGKLTDVKDAKIMLEYRAGKKRISDSVEIKNGQFQFKGSVTEPVKASITVKPLNDDGVFDIEKYMNRDTRDFYLENGTVTFNGAKAKTAAVKGGATQADYENLQKQQEPVKKKMEPYIAEVRQFMKDKNEEGRKEVFKKMAPLREESKQIEETFIKTHPASYVSWDLVKDKAVVIDPVTFEPLFLLVDKKFHNSEEGRTVAERLAATKKSAIGLQVMDFTQNDLNDKQVTLSSLKGKYVLVDFWASWCGPCRAENPNVLKAYNKFKDKNFEVLAVSLDDNKEKWLKAIKDDGMPWIHVSDLKGFKNVVAEQFGIVAIPQNLLVDPNGVIVARNLRGDALDEELAKHIK